jgi:hypothetical protein
MAIPAAKAIIPGKLIMNFRMIVRLWTKGPVGRLDGK